MSSEDRRCLSREMMDRIDAVVSGHEHQQSPEATPRYVGRVPDGPVRFDDERRAEGAERLDRLAAADSSDLVASGGYAPLRFEDDVHEGPPPDRAFRITPDGRFFGYMSTRPHGFLTAAVSHAEAEERVAEIERTRERYCPDCSGVVSFRTSAVTVTLPSGRVLRDVRIERFGISIDAAAVGMTQVARRWGRSTFEIVGENLRQLLLGRQRPLPPVPFKRSKRRYGR